MRRCFPSVVAALVVTMSSTWLTAAPPKPAPDVALQTADGDTVHMSDFKGKVVLVDFWASWCVSCKRSFPALDALYRDYQPRGFEVLAVNLDEKRQNADAFLDNYPHRMTVMFDATALSAQKFGVKAMPTSFLIDRAGMIRFTHVGYTADVAATYRQEIGKLVAER